MDDRGLIQDDVVCVYRKGKGYHFGIILENADSLSSSDEEDTDEERLKKGFIRVAWYPTGRESVIAENKVKLVERSLMPGDVVQRLVPGQDVQSGVIIDMEVKCHLHIKHTNKYIYNVDSKGLHPIQKFERGQDVVLDDMLGRVIYTNTYLVLLFSDGARCRAEETFVTNFDDISEKKERHGEFSSSEFYEGQELRGSLYHLTEAEWLHSTNRHSAKITKKKGNQTVSVTIEKIVVESVDVQWIFRIFQREDPNIGVIPPDTTVQGEQLKRLKVMDWFDYSSIEMADRMLYRIKNDDRISTVEPSQVFESTSLTIKEHGDPVPEPQNNCDVHTQEDACAVSNAEEFSGAGVKDDEYEDDSDTADETDKTASGGSSKGGGRKKRRGGGYKAAPTKFKSGKQQGQKSSSIAGGGGAASSHHKKHAERQVAADSLVPVEVMFTNSKATVIWQNGTADYDIPSSELYPVDLDTYEYFPGDFVVSQVDMEIKPDYGAIVRCSHAERTCIVNWYKSFDGIQEKEPILLQSNVEVSVYDIKEHFNFHHGQIVGLITSIEPVDSAAGGPGGLKFVGQILKLDPPGRLTVKWSDGSITQCYPQEVFTVMGEDDDEDDSSDDSSWEDESDSADTWETESEQEIIGEEMDKDDKSAANIIAKQKQELQTLLSRAESALIRLKALLNSFDVSMTAPDCFHDIIRIYRSCHDVDKILRSSFFSDPELQNLISQAKLEVKRDKANKISKQLGQLLESWGKSPSSDTAASNSKQQRTIQIGKCNMLNLSMKISNENDRGISIGIVDMNNEKNKSSEASGGLDVLCSNDKTAIYSSMDESASSGIVDSDNMRNTRMLRKEYSEPMISSRCREGRRPSDPTLQAEQMGLKSHNDDQNCINLVGENCVGKDTKLANKSDTTFNLSEGNSIKSGVNEVGTFQTCTIHTRELCIKICENLEKQILKIHEEVNKRTSRIMSTAAEGGIQKETLRVESSRDYISDCDSNISSVPNANKVDGGDNNSTASAIPQLNKSESVYSTDVSLGERSTDENNEQNKQRTGEVEENMDKSKEPFEDNLADRENAEDGGVSDNTGTTVEPSGDDSEEMMSLDDKDGELVLTKGFCMKEEARLTHKFSGQPFQPLTPRAFNTAVKKDLRLLRCSLPDGILINGFEDRLDLYSVMILGPTGTPYEDAFFLFDIMLPKDYPKSPPLCHYHSYCNDRLNPNLYEDGKICVSLLGTWSGKGSEMWTAKSNLLQVLLSIQGLILVSEPYYNEAGYEKQRGTQTGCENSRMYNEMAILKTVQSLTRMCHKLPDMFEEEIRTHLLKYGTRLIGRLRMWMAMRDDNNGAENLVDGNGVNATVTASSAAAITNMKSKSVVNGVNSSSSDGVDVEMESQVVSDKLHHLQMNGNGSFISLENNVESSVDGKDQDTQENSTSSSVDVAKNSNSTVVPEAASSLKNDENLDSIKAKGKTERKGPEFSLFPLSRGFCLTLCKTLDAFEKGLQLLKSS